MTTKQLLDIAVSFRQAIVEARDNGAFSFRDRMSRFPNGCCDETVVSLVRKTPDMDVDFRIDLDDQDLTASEPRPTYDEIK